MSDRAQKITILGSILSGLAASICCLGPILFAVLGISGAGFVLKFEQYRPVFIVITLGLLGTAFLFTYRKKKAEECAPGTLCANPKSDRVNKIVLWIAMGLTILLIFSPEILSWLA